MLNQVAHGADPLFPHPHHDSLITSETLNASQFMFIPSEQSIITEDVSTDTVRGRKSSIKLNIAKMESREGQGATFMSHSENSAALLVLLQALSTFII